jgi:hypothetical protein
VAKAAAIVAAASKQVSGLFIVVPRGVANCVGVAQHELGSPRIMISLNLSELSPSLLLTVPCWLRASDHTITYAIIIQSPGMWVVFGTTGSGSSESSPCD